MNALIFAAAALVPAATFLAPQDQRTTLTVTGAHADGAARVYVATGDLDGDGAPEPLELRVTCSGGGATSVVLTAREAGSGMATGGRQHQPLRGAVAPGTQITVTYDVKMLKGARSASGAAIAVKLDKATPKLCT